MELVEVCANPSVLRCGRLPLNNIYIYIYHFQPSCDTEDVFKASQLFAVLAWRASEPLLGEVLVAEVDVATIAAWIKKTKPSRARFTQVGDALGRMHAVYSKELVHNHGFACDCAFVLDRIGSWHCTQLRARVRLDPTLHVSSGLSVHENFTPSDNSRQLCVA